MGKKIFYCPKCGEAMEKKILGHDQYPYLVCEKGEMTLTRVLQNTIENRFEDVEKAPAGGEKGLVKDRWYCLGCGGILNKEFGCPVCGKNVRDIMQQFISRFSHIGEKA